MSSRSRRWLAAVAAMALVLGAGPAGPLRAEEPDDLEAQREQVREQTAAALAQAEAMRAEAEMLVAGLYQLEVDIAAAEAAVADAERAARVASVRAGYLLQRSKSTEADLRRAEDRLSELAVEAFMRPPPGGLGDVLAAADPYEMVVQDAIVHHAGVSLDGARREVAAVAERLAAEMDDAAAARELAEAQRLAAESHRQHLAAARAHQDTQLVAVESRLRATQDEVTDLEARDAELSERIAIAERRAVAMGLATAAGPIPLARAGPFTVHAGIAENVAAMVADAAAAGLVMAGGGWRSHEAQIHLRSVNCGPTEYDIWEKPSVECTPPTARPGNSMHERGLALDITCFGALITSRDNPCFVWLAANAAFYGLYNMPLEPWHWSVNGN